MFGVSLLRSLQGSFRTCHEAEDVSDTEDMAGPDDNNNSKSRSVSLHQIITNDQVELCEMFLNNRALADRRPTAAQVGRYLPLHVAAIFRRPEIMELLLRYEVQHPDERNSQGKTALHMTFLYWPRYKITDTQGHSLGARDVEKCVKCLQALCRYHANFNAKDESGMTPVHYAAAFDIYQAIGLLSEAGADMNAQDSNGRTPLAVAASMAHLDTVRHLLELQVSVDVTGRDGRTALHQAVVACSYRQSDGVECVELLLESGVQLSPRDHNGVTPLHLASREGNDRLIRILIDHGADTDVSTYDNAQTPLFHFLDNPLNRSKTATLHMLLKETCCIQAFDRNGGLPALLEEEWSCWRDRLLEASRHPADLKRICLHAIRRVLRMKRRGLDTLVQDNVLRLPPSISAGIFNPECVRHCPLHDHID
ncbi:PREDICTED: ankyrin repeat domain-containing protein 61-like [Branchiostoma belcheri]|uniref:Ankyrin repeat domain-containing protein 61-like n=1 Tax=Branchiostoma belcheri TaxID=7741 RepID=A0A6P5A4A0_BRABE|nr:PREDICTED: ankyrin repeat domain-containing protein 61-like [Branchiostoma belcheri]